MDREIEYTTKLAIEVMLCAMIIFACGFFGSLSRTAYINRANEKVYQEYVENMANLYYYNDKIVHGSDIVELILSHPREYDYYFYDSSNKLVGSLTAAGETAYSSTYEDHLYYWSESSIRKAGDTARGDSAQRYLGDEQSFHAVLVRDTIDYKIKGVKFYRLV